MATIYRFIIEQKGKSGGGGSTGQRANKGAAKKGKNLPLLGGSKGGVEHNRISRAINPILNKITGGVYEKGVRLTRAIGGLAKPNPKTGKIGISLPAIAIIIAFVLIQAWNLINAWNTRERILAEKENTFNYTKLENGTNAIHGAYRVSANQWSGRIYYNENK